MLPVVTVLVEDSRVLKKVKRDKSVLILLSLWLLDLPDLKIRSRDTESSVN